MSKAVLDTTVLVSAFLNPVAGAPSYDLLQLADAGAYELVLSDDILEETAKVLLMAKRLRRRYHYSDEAALDYCRELANFAAEIISEVPDIRVVRDPNDDMILACAVAAKADVLVSRDKDLLSLENHEHIDILSPEEYLARLRASSKRS